MIRYIIVSFFVLISAGNLYAKNLEITVELDKNECKIGDQISYAIRIESPPNTSLINNYELFESDNILIKERQVLRDINENGTEMVTKILVTYVPFSLGKFIIKGPNITFDYGKNGLRSTKAEDVTILVGSVMKNNSATMYNIYDNIPSQPIQQCVMYVLIILLCIMLGVIVKALISKYKYFFEKRGVIISKEEEYREYCNRLRNEIVKSEVNKKEAMRLFNKCIRYYLEMQFNIFIQDKSTGEIKQLLKKYAIKDEFREKLEDILECTDNVRFALMDIPNNDIIEMYEKFIFYVNESKNKDEKESPDRYV